MMMRIYVSKLVYVLVINPKEFFKKFLEKKIFLKKEGEKKIILFIVF